LTRGLAATLLRLLLHFCEDMRRILVSSFLVVALSLGSGGRSKAAKVVVKPGPVYGNSDAITEQELKVYDYFLASDTLEGRNLPSRGFDTAALYVASHLAEWGLKPGGSTSSTNGPLQPYFMPFELVTKQVTAESKVSVTVPAPAGGRGGAGGPRSTDFEYGKDWMIPGLGARGAPLLEPLDISGNLVFVGNGYVIHKTNTDPFAGVNVRGKIVVVAGLPAEIVAQQEQAAAGRGGRGGGTAAPLNPLGEPCLDFLTPEAAAAKNGAVAVVTFANFQQLTQLSNSPGGGRGPGANGPVYQAPRLQARPACPVVPSVTAGLALATSLFQAEKKTAAEIFYAAGSKVKQDSFALSADTKISLHLAVKSEAGHAENVIGMVEGGDPVRKNEYVVFSAHLDHVGLAAAAPGAHSVNNGADDDGSGSSALLAIAHAYAEGAAKGLRPARSVIFLWNAGEEKGLWGSQYFNEYPPVDLRKVVANLNIDMIGRTRGPGFSDPDPTHVLANPGEVMIVGPQVSSDDLGTTLETVNGNYQKLVLNHFYDATAPDKTHDNLGPQPRGQRIFYRSDHYNFAKMGIPIVFFTTGLHPDYHRTTDTPDKIDFEQMLAVSKTVSAVGWALANQADRPKLNAKLPDQLMKDMKSAQDQGWGKITPVLPPLPNQPF
jgi:Zn-dependent M28 family amino/carboxypeptidase